MKTKILLTVAISMFSLNAVAFDFDSIGGTSATGLSWKEAELRSAKMDQDNGEHNIQAINTSNGADFSALQVQKVTVKKTLKMNQTAGKNNTQCVNHISAKKAAGASYQYVKADKVVMKQKRGKGNVQALNCTSAGKK